MGRPPRPREHRLALAGRRPACGDERHPRPQGASSWPPRAPTPPTSSTTAWHIHDNDEQALDDLIAIRVEEAVDASDLDAKMFAMVNIAAPIATGGDDASYLLHVTAALDAGASMNEITGVLTAVGPNVGVFKMVAAADPLATALGVDLVAAGGDGGGDQGTSGRSRGTGARSR